MALQEEGWPLGLHPFHVRNLDRNRSLSLSTSLFTASSDSCSDLDTQSTGSSFFHEKGITLGSLIGISSILELSTRGRSTFDGVKDNRKSCNKSRPWFIFSLCSKITTDAVHMTTPTPPSLGYFLEAERRASTMLRRNQQRNSEYGPDDFGHVLPNSESRSLFVGGSVAPPLSCSDEADASANGLIEHHNRHGAILLSCLCGQLTR